MEPNALEKLEHEDWEGRRLGWLSRGNPCPGTPTLETKRCARCPDCGAIFEIHGTPDKPRWALVGYGSPADSATANFEMVTCKCCGHERPSDCIAQGCLKGHQEDTQ